MATANPDVRRWTREEYERAVEEGYFQPEERLELVDGILYGMTPQSSSHVMGVRLIQRVLRIFDGDGFDLRCQSPLAVGLDSEPEPDVAVVVGNPEDYTVHPTSAVLVVEVADSSLRHDRRKASLYARAEIPEYWILNLPERRLEVFRNPQNGAYTSRTILREGDSISPLAREITIPVASLLPRR
ncbi:MAG: Uma2 family endonuclease [Thermoanaerobaculia bacterium]